MKTVIFDLDGTLADTSGDLIAAANHCFREMGAGDLLDPLKDAAVALRGGKRMLEVGLGRLNHADPAAVVARYYPVLLEAYAGQIDRHTRLYPDAMDVVEALKRAGYGVGICTNKPEGLADLLLRRLGVRDAFAALVGADTLRVYEMFMGPLEQSHSTRRRGGRGATRGAAASWGTATRIARRRALPGCRRSS